MEIPTSLEQWLSYIDRCHPAEMALGLDRTREVGRRMAVFDFSSPVVMVAGTNGKGSCVKALQAAYQASGYRTGATFSPHMFRFNERLSIDGVAIDDESLCEAFAVVEQAREQVPLTYFEYTTLASLYLLKQANLDLIFLEVGLGGRLDAVNCVDADIAVITTIGLDHQRWLGNTPEAIAREKGGIVKAGQKALVLGPKANLPCLHEIADQHGVPVSVAAMPNFSTHLPAESVGCALSVIAALGLPCTNAHEAMAQASHIGRFTCIPGEVQTVLDVAHNPQAAAWLAAQCQQQLVTGRTLAVWSSYEDKDINGIVSEMKEVVDQWFIGEGLVPRLASVERLAQALSAQDQPYEGRGTLQEAWRAALAKARPGDRILVFGGFAILEALLLECAVDMT